MPNLDTYDGVAPVGFRRVRVHCRASESLCPRALLGRKPNDNQQGRRQLGATTMTLVHQEDLTRQGAIQSSLAVPNLELAKPR